MITALPKKINTGFTINHKEVNDTMEYANEIASGLTDEQLRMIDNFKHLDIWEQDLLLLRSQGYSLREIGARLNVSYFWVRDKLINIRGKLDK